MPLRSTRVAQNLRDIHHKINVADRILRDLEKDLERLNSTSVEEKMKAAEEIGVDADSLAGAAEVLVNAIPKGCASVPKKKEAKTKD